MKNIKFFWAALIVLGFAACEDDKYDIEPVEPIEVVPGSADFSRYVALGNSLTAGYGDGAMFIASQSNSFPNIMSEKMAMAGGGEFTQPYMSDNLGGMMFGGVQQILDNRLYFDGSGLSRVEGVPSTDVTNIMPGPYNNMGVPGAKSFHLLANGYGNLAGLPGLANPYYVRMASSPNASVLEDAMALGPTFFTLWIGSNDVLGYAYSGGDGSDQITDQAMFDGAMDLLLGTLTSSGAKGIVGNIPNITAAGFFTAVPYNPLDPTNEEFGSQIPLLNAAYAPLNQAFAFLGVPERAVVFSETAASPIVIHDESLANITPQLAQVLVGGGLDPLTAGLLATQYGQSRQANENDLVLLTASTLIGTLNQNYFDYLVGLGVPAQQAGQLAVNGITYPMQDTYVLLPHEKQEVSDAIEMFNAKIEQTVANFGLGLFDAYQFYEEVTGAGYTSNGFTLTADFLTGGFHSLDGLHFTPRGNAAVANEMLKVIDATYGSNFEEARQLIDIGDYPVFFPANLP